MHHEIHRCARCGKLEVEAQMIEYNDKWFCGILCKVAETREEERRLADPVRYTER